MPLLLHNLVFLQTAIGDVIGSGISVLGMCSNPNQTHSCAGKIAY